MNRMEPRMWMAALAAGAVMESSSAVVGNLLADPGFEAIAGSAPNAGTAPWFTIDEQNDFHIVPTTEEATSGDQSVRFTYYFNKGAVAQSTGVQIEAGKDYEMSAWVLVRDKSTGAAHTNKTTLNLSLATSPAVDGSYTYRVASFGNIPTTTNEWQYFSTVFHANQLTNWVGEYIQPRFAKGNQNSEYRILIDDVSFGVATDAALFDLAGSDYRLVVAQGGATLVDLGSHAALEVSAEPNQSATVRLLAPAGVFWDLRADAFLSLDIENMGGEEAAFRIDTCSDSAYGVDILRGRGDLMHLGWLHGGETRQFNCFLLRDERANGSLYDLSAFPGMRGRPDKLVLLGWMGLDSTRIDEITVRLPAAAHARTVRIHRIFRHQTAQAREWLESPETFFPFIDRYGQYNKADWPGKIQADQDLLDAKAAEDADLAAHPWPEAFNGYGGAGRAPDHGATGHFRTQKIGGRWMLVDPDGRPFWSFGVNSTGNTGTGSVLNRRHFFEWLPDEDPETARFLGGSAYNVGELNLWRKYGEDYGQTYKLRALQRMRSWALNTLGGWQSVDAGQAIAGKLPYTFTLSYTMPNLGEDIANPFHPDFRTNLRNALAANPEVWNDPYCIGYFVNNELQWAVNTVFDAVFTAAHPSAKEAFIGYLRETYATVADLEAAWGIALGSFEAAGNVDPATIRSVAYDDATAFYDRLAATYFRTAREEIDAVAPHKLYLGCRWHNWNPRVVAAAADHVDVFSFNLYRKAIGDHAYYGIDKPFIATEFNFGAVDRGKFFPGLGWSSDQRNRGEQASHYARSAMDNPLCVGAHWFMWMNTVTWGRGNGENAGMGLVDDADTPYPEIRAAMRQIGHGLYAYLGVEDEVSPPQPDPAGFSAPPAALDAVTVAMAATPATGSYAPIEYRFEETTGNLGGAGSDWQASNIHTNGGLLPNTRYAYAVTLRDGKSRTGERSAVAGVVTPQAPPVWVETETLIDEDFAGADEPGNESSPFPAYRWHASDATAWEREDGGNGTSLALVGPALRVGFGYDEVVARYFIEVPWDLGSDYRLSGGWQIANTLDVHLGLLAGFAEYGAGSGELVRRIKSETIGETHAPFIGQSGSFSLGLSGAELAAAGVNPSNLVGVFFHHDDDGTLFSQGATLKSDVYLLDQVRLERIHGFVDTDGDGIPDAVEIALGLDPFDPADGLLDLDGDGVSNMAEFRAGTALDDPDDVLRISPPVPAGEGLFEVVVPGAQVHGGRLYILETNPRLGGRWVAMDSRRPAGAGGEIALVGGMDPRTGFARVRVEWAP